MAVCVPSFRVRWSAAIGYLMGAVAFAVLLTAPAGARELTDAEDKALKARLSAFESAIEQSDVDGLTSVVPPSILEAVAKNAGVTVEQLTAAMAEQMKAMMNSVEFESFGMDLDEITEGERKDGEPYWLIPTESVIKIPGTGTMTTNTHTLAFQDEGEWYLVRIEDQNQIGILRQVYPGFADVEFPEGTTSMAVEE